MLEFKRKQMAAVGDAQMRSSLADFLNRELGGEHPMELEQLDAQLDEIIVQCRKAGLKSQRAVAAYALACALFGSERIASDPSITAILADRTSSQMDRALLIELWTIYACGDQPRAQEA